MCHGYLRIKLLLWKEDSLKDPLTECVCVWLCTCLLCGEQCVCVPLLPYTKIGAAVALGETQLFCWSCQNVKTSHPNNLKLCTALTWIHRNAAGKSEMETINCCWGGGVEGNTHRHMWTSWTRFLYLRSHTDTFFNGFLFWITFLNVKSE